MKSLLKTTEILYREGFKFFNDEFPSIPPIYINLPINKIEELSETITEVLEIMRLRNYLIPIGICYNNILY